MLRLVHLARHSMQRISLWFQALKSAFNIYTCRIITAYFQILCAKWNAKLAFERPAGNAFLCWRPPDSHIELCVPSCFGNSAVGEYKKNMAGVRNCVRIIMDAYGYLIWLTPAMFYFRAPNTAQQTSHATISSSTPYLCVWLLCIAQPVSTAFNLFLVRVFLLLWSVCGNLVSLGRFVNCRAPVLCPHPNERVWGSAFNFSFATLLLCRLRPSV